jgi:hypothetical protein
MKNFKSFIQLDEVERVKYKDGIANKMAYASDEVKTKGNRLDNKQPFGEGDAYDKDVKASPKPNDKEAAAQRAKLAALAARKAMMTNKMSEAESIDESDSFQSHLDKAAAAKKAGKTADYHSHMQKYHDSHAQMASRNPNWGGGAGSERKNQNKAISHGDKAAALRTTKKEDADLLSDLYDQLDESNQEIFLAQLEEDAEVLLAFAKTIAKE